MGACGLGKASRSVAAARSAADVRLMTAADIDRLWRAVAWLSAQPRGGVAVRVWACLWSETDLTDYRVKADRQWIAEKAGTTVEQVSRILTMLEEVGAIRREHGRRGRRGRQLAMWMVPEFSFPN
jgi:CRP-like cAMP-binding protein